MPILAQEHFPIATKDILSWQFDDPQYDLDQPVYIDAENPKRSISGNQGRSLIKKLAAGFRKAGLKRGDCVVLASFNDLYYAVIALGIIAAGGVFSGTNPAYTAAELTHNLKIVKAKFVICEPDILKNVLDAKYKLPRSNIFVFENTSQPVPTGFTSWKALLEHGEADWHRFDDLETSKNTTAMLLFSSGTTGLPKAVMLSHYNFVAQHTLVNEYKPLPFKTSRLIPLPMFHAASTPTAVITPFRSGDVSYIMRRFDLETFMAHVEKYQITDLSPVVPPVAIAIIMSPLSKKYSLQSVKRSLCGAAPLDKGPQARLQALFHPDATFIQVWGMTETSCISSMFYYPEQDATGSVGRMIPNIDAKLVDDNGKEVGPYNVRGEICIRGPNVVRGYFENPEANARDWDSDGYFHTGDIAYVDGKTGAWYIVDRKKELIKVRGFQVAPPEIEGALLSHPNIVDAAVIGIKVRGTHGEETELPRAYVVTRPGSPKLTEQEVIKHCDGLLSKYKRIDGGVVFVDAIPKTASGKILKRDLRERAAKEIGAKL